ncbi:MAG: GNAT family N-acetyltransferase [Jiangellaceae bacterium]
MELRGAVVVLRPVSDRDVDELRRIRYSPEIRRWWGEVEDDDWPFDDDPDATPFTVLVDGRVAGLVQYGEITDEQYRHAGIDLFLDPAVHGRGIGRDTVRTLARHLIEDRGHHRLVIDPAAANEVAIRCYSAVGFRPVGVMRQYERDAEGDGWHDGLLMDLLAPELR